MDTNEQIRPFVFPGPGQQSAVVSTGPRPAGELESVAGDFRRKRRESSAGGRKRLRNFIQSDAPEQERAESESEASLRPAFAKKERAADASGPERRSPLLSRKKRGVIESEASSVTELDDEYASEVADVSVTDDAEGSENTKGSTPHEPVMPVAEAQETGLEESAATESEDVHTGQPDPPSVQSAESSAGQQSGTPEVAELAPTADLQPVKAKPSPAATLQKALDDMFRKGLEQGRQEALEQQSAGVHQQALDKGLEEGREAGFQEGMQQGLQAAAVELEQRFAGLETMIAEVQACRRLLSHRQVVDAAKLLERLVIEVVRVELRHSAEQIRTVVEEAVQLLDRADHEMVSLRVHPDDAGWLQGFVENSSESFAVRPDASITRGGCRIEGRLGHVDASLEERLSDCIEQLRACLLEDPQEMPAIDLSPVYEQSQAALAVAARESLRPEPELKTLTPAVAPAVVTESETAGMSGLGAWGDLGQ